MAAPGAEEYRHSRSSLFETKNANSLEEKRKQYGADIRQRLTSFSSPEQRQIDQFVQGITLGTNPLTTEGIKSVCDGIKAMNIPQHYLFEGNGVCYDIRVLKKLYDSAGRNFDNDLLLSSILPDSKHRRDFASQSLKADIDCGVTVVSNLVPAKALVSLEAYPPLANSTTVLRRIGAADINWQDNPSITIVDTLSVSNKSTSDIQNVALSQLARNAHTAWLPYPLNTDWAVFYLSQDRSWSRIESSVDNVLAANPERSERLPEWLFGWTVRNITADGDDSLDFFAGPTLRTSDRQDLPFYKLEKSEYKSVKNVQPWLAVRITSSNKLIPTVVYAAVSTDEPPVTGSIEGAIVLTQNLVQQLTNLNETALSSYTQFKGVDTEIRMQSLANVADEVAADEILASVLPDVTVALDSSLNQWVVEPVILPTVAKIKFRHLSTTSFQWFSTATPEQIQTFFEEELKYFKLLQSGQTVILRHPDASRIDDVFPLVVTELWGFGPVCGLSHVCSAFDIVLVAAANVTESPNVIFEFESTEGTRLPDKGTGALPSSLDEADNFFQPLQIRDRTKLQKEQSQIWRSNIFPMQIREVRPRVRPDWQDRLPVITPHDRSQILTRPLSIGEKIAMLNLISDDAVDPRLSIDDKSLSVLTAGASDGATSLAKARTYNDGTSLVYRKVSIADSVNAVSGVALSGLHLYMWDSRVDDSDIVRLAPKSAKWDLIFRYDEQTCLWILVNAVMLPSRFSIPTFTTSQLQVWLRDERFSFFIYDHLEDVFLNPFVSPASSRIGGEVQKLGRGISIGTPSILHPTVPQIPIVNPFAKPSVPTTSIIENSKQLVQPTQTGQEILLLAALLNEPVERIEHIITSNRDYSGTAFVDKLIDQNPQTAFGFSARVQSEPRRLLFRPNVAAVLAYMFGVPGLVPPEVVRNAFTRLSTDAYKSGRVTLPVIASVSMQYPNSIRESALTLMGGNAQLQIPDSLATDETKLAYEALAAELAALNLSKTK